MVRSGPDHWRVRYFRTLREEFHVYRNGRGELRTEHAVRFLGLTVLRLHYKLERLAHAGEASGAVIGASGIGVSASVV